MPSRRKPLDSPGTSTPRSSSPKRASSARRARSKSPAANPRSRDGGLDGGSANLDATAVLQALLTLPAAQQQQLRSALGVPAPPPPTSAQDSYGPLFIGSLCLQLRDHLPANLVSSLEAAKEKGFEGLDADFFTRVASSVQLNPDVSRSSLAPWWFESLFDFHPPKAAARAVEEFRSKPELQGKDSALSSFHETSLRPLLRVCVHLGVSAISQPAEGDPDSAQLLKDFRALGSLAFLLSCSALSDLTRSRKKIMYDALGFKPHEIGGSRSLFDEDDRRLLEAAVQQRQLESPMLDKPKKKPQPRPRRQQLRFKSRQPAPADSKSTEQPDSGAAQQPADAASGSSRRGAGRGDGKPSTPRRGRGGRA